MPFPIPAAEVALVSSGKGYAFVSMYLTCTRHLKEIIFLKFFENTSFEFHELEDGI